MTVVLSSDDILLLTLGGLAGAALWGASRQLRRPKFGRVVEGWG
jgi:hypothetical protein